MIEGEFLDLATEEWRTSPSLPDYDVSSLGRIRRKPYQAEMPNGGVRTYGGKAWYGCNVTSDKRVIFRYKGKTYKVHRLVCEAFNGPPPNPDSVVMHLDEDYTNNKPSNLSWGTQKENLNAPGFLSYCKSRLGENSPWRKHKSAGN